MQVPAGFRLAAGATAFERRLAELARAVPPGRVVSYGALAGLAGRPGAARAVGHALARGLDVPAHRIVNARGRLAPGWEVEQAELLRAEGVVVAGGHVAAPIPWWEPPGAARPARPRARGR